MLLTGVLAFTFVTSAARSQSIPSATKPVTPDTPYHFHQSRLPVRAELYYQGFWGVDSLAVKAAESGEVVRFTYRVFDAMKAKPLNDKKSAPFLENPQAGVKLVVPSIEQVGQLRQSSTPIAGKVYWMAFSNTGRRVKRGDHVNVVIGPFRANGLTVD